MAIPKSYSIDKIPQWTGAGNPTTPRTTPTRGFDVNAPRRKNALARAQTYGRANGTLCTNAFKWPIFITDVGIDLSVQGSMAQSQFTRDFYPRNFVIPSFQVSGQAIDQLDYGMMCDFIHMSQKSMLKSFSSVNRQTSPLMQLQVASRGFSGQRQRGIGVTVNGSKLTNQIIRGPHQEIQALGFVTTMPRSHEAGVVAPTWSFGFEVVSMIKGPYIEPAPISPAAQKTWIDLLNSSKNITGDSTLVSQNKKILTWAQKNSVNVLSGGA